MAGGEQAPLPGQHCGSHDEAQLTGCPPGQPQLPLLQICSCGQTVPQPPQLFLSVCVLTQVLLGHSVKPAQFGTQPPPEQLTVPPVGGEQTLPQLPQCAGLVWVLTHWPAHFELFGAVGQLKSQLPLLQNGTPPAGALQALPQPPQLATSLAGLTHTLPHLMNGAWQTKSQLPPLQNGMPLAGAVQGLLQPPQLARSLSVLISQPVRAAPSQSAQPPTQPPI